MGDWEFTFHLQACWDVTIGKSSGNISTSLQSSMEAVAGKPQLLWKHFATSLFLNHAKLQLNVKWEKQRPKLKLQTQLCSLTDLKNRMQPPVFPSKLIGDVEETTVTTVANSDSTCRWATNEENAPDEYRQIWNYTNVHQDLAANKINTLWLVTQLMINSPFVLCGRVTYKTSNTQLLSVLALIVIVSIKPTLCRHTKYILKIHFLMLTIIQ